MKKVSLYFLLLFVCMGLAKAEFVTNGDFEDPDMTGTNQTTSAPPWTSKRSDNNISMDEKGANNLIPGPVDNQVARIKQGNQTGTIRHLFAVELYYSPSDVYTLSFNACEVNWQAGEATQNTIEVGVRNIDHQPFAKTSWVEIIDLDGTHDGAQTGDWTAAQTFSFTVDSSTFIDIAEGDQLQLQFKATEGTNFVDNVSFVLGAPGIPYDPVVSQKPGSVAPVTAGDVAVQLSWKAAGDPNEAVTGNQVLPEVVDQYVFMSPGGVTDPNLYYIGATGIDPGTSDPNSQYPVLDTQYIENLDFETTYYWAVVEAIDGYEQNFTPNVSKIEEADPNNIVGSTWSFITISDIPEASLTPKFAVADLDGDPNFICSISSATAVTAGDVTWQKDGGAVTNPGATTSFADNGDGTYTAILQLFDVAISDEGEYTCTVSTADPVTAKLGVKRLMAYWKLDSDGANWDGSNYLDVSTEDPVAHNADPNGIPTFVTGINNEAVAMDPNNGAAQSGTWNPMEYTDAMTLTCWVNWAENDGFWYVMLGKKDADGHQWRLSLRPTDGKISFGSDASKIWSNNAMPTNEWVFIAVTFGGNWDNNQGFARLYLMPEDTTYLDRQTGNVTLSDKTDAEFTIGKSGAAAAYFNGSMDDIRVYNYVLTEAEIADMYYALSGDGFCDESLLSSFDSSGPDGVPDCKVDLNDFADFAAQWLECIIIPTTACN